MNYLWERNGTERDRLVSVARPMSAVQDWAALRDISALILLDMEPGGSYLLDFALGGWEFAGMGHKVLED